MRELNVQVNELYVSINSTYNANHNYEFWILNCELNMNYEFWINKGLNMISVLSENNELKNIDYIGNHNYELWIMNSELNMNYE